MNVEDPLKNAQDSVQSAEESVQSAEDPVQSAEESGSREQTSVDPRPEREEGRAPVTCSATVHPVVPSLLPRSEISSALQCSPLIPLFIRLLIDHLHNYASDPGLEVVHFVHFVDAR